MMKKSIKLIAALTMFTLVFTGCASSTPKEEGTTDTSETTEITETTDDTDTNQEVIKLQFAHDNNPGDPVQDAAERWAELLKEKSNF